MSTRKIIGTLGVAVAMFASLPVGSASAVVATPTCNDNQLCYFYNSGWAGGRIGFNTPEGGGGWCIANYTGWYFSDNHPVANQQAGAANMTYNYTNFLFINHIASDCSSVGSQPADPLQLDARQGWSELGSTYKNNLMAHTWY
jgi:hypothetical protein